MRSGLFLDFDGVLCDSVAECYVSSWIAFFERYRGEQVSHVSIDHYRRFRAYRPYIRRGEDYLLMHSLIMDNVPISSQVDFDAAVGRAGTEHMATYRALLYTVREDLVQQSLEKWRALHTPYAGVLERLRLLARDPRVWIVSTKRQEFIIRVLEGWGIRWPVERISMPVSKTKMEIVESTVAVKKLTDALFVDDHEDDLDCRPDSSIACRLAAWGHVAPETLRTPRLQLMQLHELLSRMDERIEALE